MYEYKCEIIRVVDGDTVDALTVSGGGGASNQATYFYTWSTSNGSGLDPSAEDQSGLGPGTYTVIVKDINDCSITETFTITEAPALTYNLDSIKNIITEDIKTLNYRTIK